ncbi:MucR family transcriptional regulator [Sphingomonadaceae bacterium OTU29THOMA1]|nr:MucR family transcriptional regulator [Sphingomonadaceae bacterium OTU29THOMA1]
MSFDSDATTVAFAADLTIAWLGNTNNRVNADDVPAFLQQMYRTITDLSAGNNATGTAAEPAKEYTPAVSARKSLASPDFIISMIDGKPYKTLRRHLSTNGMTPEEYRERFGLKADYPMVAPSYSAARQAMAKKIGLGRKPGQTNAAKAEAKVAKPAKVRDAKAAAQAHLGGTSE